MRNLTATLCLTVAVLLGSAGMSWGADFQKGLDAYESGDFATALREWTPLAEQGDALTQYNLGQMYRTGQGVPQDYKTAVKWYRLAAEQGHASAHYNLGVRYHKGNGVIQDNVYAKMWGVIAAANGYKDGTKLFHALSKGMPPSTRSALQTVVLECIRSKFKEC